MMERIIVDKLWKEFCIGTNHQTSLNKFKSVLSGKESRKKFWVLKDISFTANAGEIIGIIGKNGSGKSTLLRTIAGIYNKNRGDIITHGKLVSLIGMDKGLDLRLSAKDNIYRCCSILGLNNKEIKKRFNEIIAFAELKNFVYTKLYQFSSGMISRLAFSIAIHSIKKENIDILLLDEVFSVGDEEFRTKCSKKINELVKSGATVLIVSHELEMLKKICNRIIWMDGGAIKRDGGWEVIVEYKNRLELPQIKGDEFLKNKVLNEIETLKRKTILQSKPLSLTVVLTSKCNLKCRMCGFWSGKWCNEGKSFDINEKVVIEIERLLPYLHNVIWTGGEIFLSKYFERLFDKASTYKHLSQTILTNGLLINEKWAKKLVKNNVTINYSIDGATKRIYEKIRNGGKFEDLIKSIKLINKYKKTYNSKTEKIIHFTVMRSNYREIEKILDFAYTYNFERVDFLSILGTSKENIFYSNDLNVANYLENIRPKIFEKASKYGIKINYQLPTKINLNYNKDKSKEQTNKFVKNNPILCNSPWKKMHIENNKVKINCYCPQDIGDLKKNSLEEIWNSKKMQIYRKKITKNCFDWCDYKCTLGINPWINI